MKSFFLILFSWCFIISAYSQASKTSHVGWLFLMGDRAICFSANTKEMPLAKDFFKCEKRIGGQQYAIKKTNQMELKNKGAKFVIQMFYGVDAVGIVPITFNKIINDDSRRAFASAKTNGFVSIEKLELFYKQKEYLIEFSSFDSSYIVNLSPESPKQKLKK